MISNRSVVVGIVAIVLLITLFPLVHAGFTTPDDFLYSRWAHAAKKWGYAWDSSKAMGRFQMTFHVALNWVPYALKSGAYLKAIQIGSIVATLLLFGHAVSRFARDRDHALLCLLCFAAFLPNMWENYIYAAFPFVFQFGGCFLLLSLLAFRDSLDDDALRHRLKAAVFLFVAAMTYEAFLAYVVVFVLLAWHYRLERGARAVLAACVPVLLAAASYLAIYLAWRAFYPSTYAGALLGRAALDLPSVAKVVWQLAAASLPGYVFTHFDEIHYRFAAAPEGFERSVGALLANLQVEWVIKAALVGLGVWLILLARRGQTERPRPAAPVALGAALFMLPVVPLAVTPKYQEWVASGTQAYVVTYFSYFGVVVVLAALVAALGTAGAANSRTRRAAAVTVAAVAAALSLVTDYGNQAMHRSQALNGQRWELFGTMIASSDFAEVPAGSCLLLDGLTRSLVYAGYAPYVWQAWIEQETGKVMTVVDERSAFLDCTQGGRRPGFLMRYRQQENAQSQFIGLARVEGNAGGHLVGNRMVIRWSGGARRFALLLESPGGSAPTTARIDGADVAAAGTDLRFPVDTLRQRSGIGRTEIRMPRLLLDAVSMTTYPE